MKDVYHPSYNDVHNMCHSISETFRYNDMQFGVILGLARGGLIPATLLSHMMNIPMVSAHYSSRHGKGDDKNHDNVLPTIPQSQAILVVDDICDSGWTLREVVDHYLQKGNAIYSAVLYYKAIPTPPITPMIRCQTIQSDSPWVIFPWEREGILE